MMSERMIYPMRKAARRIRSGSLVFWTVGNEKDRLEYLYKQVFRGSSGEGGK